ncbi:MAG TPA: hypothetical protein VNP20_02725 [Nocardioidaceae bacterium]|nr:hypothetical protein [Nocardioidaceae bacterium]
MSRRLWEPSARTIQRSVWKPGSSGNCVEALKAILCPSGDQSEKKLGTWMSRRWCVPSGLAAQIVGGILAGLWNM